MMKESKADKEGLTEQSSAEEKATVDALQKKKRRNVKNARRRVRKKRRLQNASVGMTKDARYVAKDNSKDNDIICSENNSQDQAVSKDKEQADQIILLKNQMEECNLATQCEEVIWDLIPMIQKVNENLSLKEDRQLMDNLTWRVKTPDSIVKKLIRKGRDITLDNAVHTLNDLAGVRVICSFQDDVYAMAKAIKKMDGVRVIKEKNYIAKPKASGYRSIHLIVEVPGEERTNIRAEIQLRSVAMNYWAILDHQLCYKNENKEAEKVRKELKSYAIAIAKIDKKFLKLRKKIENI